MVRGVDGCGCGCDVLVLVFGVDVEGCEGAARAVFGLAPGCMQRIG